MVSLPLISYLLVKLIESMKSWKWKLSEIKILWEPEEKTPPAGKMTNCTIICCERLQFNKAKFSSSSKKQQAAASSSKQQQAAASSSKRQQQQAAANLLNQPRAYSASDSVCTYPRNRFFFWFDQSSPDIHFGMWTLPYFTVIQTLICLFKLKRARINSTVYWTDCRANVLHSACNYISIQCLWRTTHSTLVHFSFWFLTSVWCLTIIKD